MEQEQHLQPWLVTRISPLSRRETQPSRQIDGGSSIQVPLETVYEYKDRWKDLKGH